MNTDLLAQAIKDIALLEGSFTLRSGQVTDEYFDKYLFESAPHLLAKIAQKMAPLIPTDVEVLAGLEMGGIPVATMLSHYTGLPATFVRKEAKLYGTAKLAEGADVAGKQVLLVEDVVTSGGQVVLSGNELRALGAHISHAICVIDRQQGGKEKLALEGVALLSLFKREDI